MAQILCLFGGCEERCSANAGFDVCADAHANTQPNANASRFDVISSDSAVRFVELPRDSDQLLEVLFHLKKGLFGLWLV